MQSVLKEKLWAYIVHNNPDLMFNLQEDYSVTRYLEEKVSSIIPMLSRLLGEDKPIYIVEELCLEELTKDLRPSKFNYIKNILEEEFEQDYKRMKETGLLTYEIVNLIAESETAFETLGFTEEKEDDQMLRSAIVGTIQQYLESK